MFLNHPSRPPPLPPNALHHTHISFSLIVSPSCPPHLSPLPPIFRSLLPFLFPCFCRLFQFQINSLYFHEVKKNKTLIASRKNMFVFYTFKSYPLPCYISIFEHVFLCVLQSNTAGNRGCWFPYISFPCTNPPTTSIVVENLSTRFTNLFFSSPCSTVVTGYRVQSPWTHHWIPCCQTAPGSLQVSNKLCINTLSSNYIRTQYLLTA